MSHRELICDILIVGGGLGGCAAALAAASLGRMVIVTEQCRWIGGQLSSQAVSAPDEHRYIESHGATRSYLDFRRRVRQYYRDNYPLSKSARDNPLLNPGNGWVSRLCHEPKVSLAVLEEVLSGCVNSGNLKIFTSAKPVSASVAGDQVESVTFQSGISGDVFTVCSRVVIDATELGELLPLAGVEYVTGAESADDTGEPHAKTGPARPDDIQSFTWCFLLDRSPDTDNRIDKPEGYDEFVKTQPFDWIQRHPVTGEEQHFILWDLPGWQGLALWTYRRALDSSIVDGGPSDISLVNWPLNDCRGNFIDVPESEAQAVLQAGKRLSFSLIYWLQNDAPRPDGGFGFPEIRLRSDCVGTEDGMAQFPYIRESRRIIPEFRVLEQHIASEIRGGRLGEEFFDSVGIGLYRIDIHPSLVNPLGMDIGCCPFTIPLGALIPVRMKNLIAGCKNIGTTHITNGAYRVHPVEWNIGESAGALAAFCLDRGAIPTAVRNTPSLLADYQGLLVSMGIPLAWPPDAEPV